MPIVSPDLSGPSAGRPRPVDGPPRPWASDPGRHQRGTVREPAALGQGARSRRLLHVAGGSAKSRLGTYGTKIEIVARRPIASSPTRFVASFYIAITYASEPACGGPMREGPGFQQTGRFCRNSILGERLWLVTLHRVCGPFLAPFRLILPSLCRPCAKSAPVATPFRCGCRRPFAPFLACGATTAPRVVPCFGGDPLRIIFLKPTRIALSFPAKPCSVSSRVDRFRVAEKGAAHGAEHSPGSRRPATDGGQAVAGALRRGLRRDDARPQQDLAGPPHRLAAAGAGRGRPVRTRPPPRRGAGQRRRPPPQPAPAQGRRRAPGDGDGRRGRPGADARLPPVGSVLVRKYRGQTLAGAGAGRRLRVRGPRLPLPQRRRQGRSPAATATAFCSFTLPGKGATDEARRTAPRRDRRCPWSAARSTRARARRRGWSRSSTAWTPNASRPRPSSAARPARAGRACPTATTTAASPAATWSGPP